MLIWVLLTVFHFVNPIQIVNRHPRAFEIDYKNDQFLKDGEPFRYISGSLHYFRVPRAYWRDRMKKYRAAGLNAISTYIEWKKHEPEEGVFSFEGENDLEHFIKLAVEEELLVILRPGPYICAERDLGGYPVWIFNRYPDLILRTNDPRHRKFVLSWFKVLFPKLQPLLYGNGGPIIMLQVENEYGSYFACDHEYTAWLRDLFKGYVKDKAVLFTTDGNGKGYFKCGPIPGVFTTVDFGCGGNVSEDFQALREYQPHGPLVNSEMYTGRLTHWGEQKATVPASCVVNTTRELLQHNASFNYYVFHGGTNFDFSSGANSQSQLPVFQPTTTSYDFDAPISESGNLTDKYYALKALLSEFVPVVNITVNSSETVDYGTVVLESKGSLFDSGTGDEYGTYLYPRSFESLELYSGLMLYETTLPAWHRRSGYLVANEVHDRAIVFVNKEPVGILSRSTKSFSMFIGGQAGQSLGLLVENQGHINYNNMSDLKGLTDNVTLNGAVLISWKHTGYALTNVSQVSNLPTVDERTAPAYLSGTFNLSNTSNVYQDTFVDTTGWGKGVVYVNGFCLGRYWPGEGPQITLYLPGSLLRPNNTIILLELEIMPSNMSLRLTAEPQFSSYRVYIDHVVNASDTNDDSAKSVLIMK